MPVDSKWGPWHVNESLVVLGDELSRAHGGVVLGTIADHNHTPPSDHIPNAAQRVNAMDVMLGPHFSSTDAEGFADNIRFDPRVKYIIWNRQIFHPGHGWIHYNGSNPHTDHVHLSVLDSLHTDVQPWNIGGRKVSFPNITGYMPTLLLDDHDPVADMHYVTRAQILLDYLVPEKVEADGFYGPKTAAAVKEIMKSGNGLTINNDVWATLMGMRNHA